MPFVRIAGAQTAKPLLVARVQTDGSFGSRKGARVAAIVEFANRSNSSRGMTHLEGGAVSSTETEWASLLYGLRLALECNQDAIGLENDNLGVVHGLAFPRKPLRHEYAQHYRNEILTLAAETEWTGVRWIPRAANRADDLF